MRLEAPAVADRGDTFVVRSYSPARAVAGGTVILPVAPKRRRGNPDTVSELLREESGSPEDRLVATLERLPTGGTPGEVRRTSGLPEAEFDTALASASKEGRAVVLEDESLVAGAVLTRFARCAEELLAGFQSADPFRWGTSRGELKSRLSGGLSAVLFERILVELKSTGRVTQREDHVRLGDPAMRLPPDLETQVAQVAKALEDGGAAPPSRKELGRELGFAVAPILDHLTFEGQAVKVTPELYLSHNHFHALTAWLETFFQGHSSLEVAELKHAWGMSRKYSVPVLEYLDREAWTRREGDVRVPGKRLRG
jgi:selenocysteine-specific elongation factor